VSEPAPPAGFTVRRPDPGDAEAVAQLMRAFELDTEGREDTSADDVRSEWVSLDLSRDAWLVEDASGAAVAAVTLRLDGGVFEADGYVHPACRRRGLGGYLLDVTEAAARAAEPAVDRLHTGISLRDPAARALLAARGYAPVRHFWTMATELDGPPPAPAPLPGVAIAPVEPDGWRQFHAVKEAAFADHWGYTPETYEAWLKRRTMHPEHDPGLWFVARAEGRVVGMIECSQQAVGGFVHAIGVLPAGRGRGIGEALLRHAFAELARRGERVVRLGVDAANPTGATRLYERVGMHVEAEYAVMEKRLRR
jgi:mycothiol synthase